MKADKKEWNRKVAGAQGISCRRPDIARFLDGLRGSDLYKVAKLIYEDGLRPGKALESVAGSSAASCCCADSKGLTARQKRQDGKKDRGHKMPLAGTNKKKAYSRRRLEQVFCINSEKTKIRITPYKLWKMRIIDEAESCAYDTLEEKTGLRLGRQRAADPKLVASIRFRHNRDKLIFRLLLETGCSAKELSQMKVADIYRDNKEAMPTISHKKKRQGTSSCNQLSATFARKGSKSRIELSASLSRLLLKAISNKSRGSFVIDGKRADGISARRIQQIIASYGCNTDDAKAEKKQSTAERSAKADMDRRNRRLTPGMLRNLAIIRMRMQGYDCKTTAKMIGIKRIDMFTHGLDYAKEYPVRGPIGIEFAQRIPARPSKKEVVSR